MSKVTVQPGDLCAYDHQLNAGNGGWRKATAEEAAGKLSSSVPRLAEALAGFDYEQGVGAAYHGSRAKLKQIKKFAVDEKMVEDQEMAFGGYLAGKQAEAEEKAVAAARQEELRLKREGKQAKLTTTRGGVNKPVVVKSKETQGETSDSQERAQSQPEGELAGARANFFGDAQDDPGESG